MKRKIYQEPTMKLVEVRQQCRLLAGSGEGVSAGRKAYGEAVIDTWEEE